MPKNCDHTSVGVVISNQENQVALLNRANYPYGYAPPAGHIDDHGSPEQAAINEVQEELGLQIAISALIGTTINNRRVNLSCKRPGGDYHDWTVYEAKEFKGELKPNEETKGANWYDLEQIQQLAERTRQFQSGKIDDSEWQANPGLEIVWLKHLVELGYVQ